MKRLLVLLMLVSSWPALVWAQAGPISVPSTMQIPNDTTTGTLPNRLAKIVGGKAILAATTDATATPPIDLYVCMAGCGTFGLAQLVQTGEAFLEMDAANASGASGWFIIASATTGGKGHAQSSPPTSGMVVGKLWQDSTSISAGAKARIAAGNQPYIPGSPGSGSGTVNPGNDKAIACYFGSGTTVDDCAQPSGTTGIYPKWVSGALTNSTLPAAGTGACTNQVVTGTNADAAPACASVTGAMTNNTIAKTGSGIDTTSQPIAAPADWAFQGKSTPSALGGNVNLLTTCTLSTCELSTSGTGDRTIFGMQAPLTDGTTRNLCNNGPTNNIILANESSSTGNASDRFSFDPTDRPFGDDITLVPRQCVALQYSGGTVSRWRRYGGSALDSDKIRTILVTAGDPETTSPALIGGTAANAGNHTLQGFQNHYGRDLAVLAVGCTVDVGTVNIRVRYGDGSDTNVLSGTGVCTCSGLASGATPSFTACSVPTTPPVVKSWATTPTTRTCTTAPCSLDFMITGVSGGAKYVAIDVKGILR